MVAVLAMLVGGNNLWAQRYHWEWSPRSPRVMPRTFVGVEGAIGSALHRTTLPYVEELITCCTFADGTGTPLRFAVIAERWVAPQTAVTAGLGYSQTSGVFTAATQGFPTVEYGTVETAYDLETSFRYLHLQGGVRQRLFGSMASIGLDLRAMVRVAAEYTLTERVVSPDDYRFADGSRSIAIDQQVLYSSSSVLLEPSIVVQYDLPLQLGFVISPMVSVQMPLWSVSATHPWTYLQASAGLRIVRGL
jgi:hypothetical protein